jgi:hypothetical protein
MVLITIPASVTQITSPAVIGAGLSILCIASHPIAPTATSKSAALEERRGPKSASSQPRKGRRNGPRPHEHGLNRDLSSVE